MHRYVLLMLCLAACKGKSEAPGSSAPAGVPPGAPGVALPGKPSAVPAPQAPNPAAPAAPAAAQPASPVPAVAQPALPADHKATTKTLEWIKVPGGPFHYGCEPQDKDCEPNEKPGLDVTISDLSVTRTEVTVEQYAACLAAKKCAEPKPGAGAGCTWRAIGKEKHPINCVTQEEAQAFCTWAGGRLPTAQEWEYAAKGGESRVFPWGNEIYDPSKARYGAFDGTSLAGSHPAGASKHGLQDMAGNVWEWTADKLDDVFVEVRGASWRNQGYLMRSSKHGKRPGTDRDDWIGFRCVK